MSGNILKSSRRQRGHGPEARGDPSPYPMVMTYVLGQVLDCQRCSRGLSGEYVIFLGTLCRLVVPRRVRIYWYPHILRGIGLMYEGRVFESMGVEGGGRRDAIFQMNPL